MKKLCKKRNTDFELLKKIIGKIQLSKIRAMFLVLGVLVSSIITFVRPQIVSTLTDNGLVKKNWGIVIWWCIILIICAAIEYGNGLAQIKICVEINNQFVMQTLQKSSFPEKSLLFTLVSFSELETNTQYSIIEIK